MSKRQLTKQQRQRIRARQHHCYQQNLEHKTTLAEDNNLIGPPRDGLVVVRYGSTIAVSDEQANIHSCTIRQHVGAIVCGDHVIWQPTQSGYGVIIALKPRRSELSRLDYGGRQKPLAANLTALVVVLAPQPAPSGYLLDQYLAASELIAVTALIVVNKIDLLTMAEQPDFIATLIRYKQIGYEILTTSIHQSQTIDHLRCHLTGQTTILVGQSGVGKSSLIHALLPDQSIQIGQLSAATGLGKHTTSAATCYRLADTGWLIDSPGVRSFRLGAMPFTRLEQGFREFKPYQGRCRFANCQHQHEPDCAIQQAVAEGRIARERLVNFHRLAKHAIT
jgi:ribosome biogenesis GTPase